MQDRPIVQANRGKPKWAVCPEDGRLRWQPLLGLWMCQVCQKTCKTEKACRRHNKRGDCENRTQDNPSWQLAWDFLTLSCRYCGQPGFRRRRHIRNHLYKKQCPKLPDYNWNALFGTDPSECAKPPETPVKGEGKDVVNQKLLSSLQPSTDAAPGGPSTSAPPGNNDDDDDADDDDEDDCSEEEEEGGGKPPWGAPGAQQGLVGQPYPLWNQGAAPGSTWQRGPRPNVSPPAQQRPPLAGGPRPLRAEWGGPPEMARGPRPLMAAWPEQRPMGQGPRPMMEVCPRPAQVRGPRPLMARQEPVARGPRPLMAEWPGQPYQQGQLNQKGHPNQPGQLSQSGHTFPPATPKQAMGSNPPNPFPNDFANAPGMPQHSTANMRPTGMMPTIKREPEPMVTDNFPPSSRNMPPVEVKREPESESWFPEEDDPREASRGSRSVGQSRQQQYRSGGGSWQTAGRTTRQKKEDRGVFSDAPFAERERFPYDAHPDRDSRGGVSTNRSQERSRGTVGRDGSQDVNFNRDRSQDKNRGNFSRDRSQDRSRGNVGRDGSRDGNFGRDTGRDRGCESFDREDRRPGDMDRESGRHREDRHDRDMDREGRRHREDRHDRDMDREDRRHREDRHDRDVDREGRLYRGTDREDRRHRNMDREGRHDRDMDREDRLHRVMDREGRLDRGMDREGRLDRGIDREGRLDRDMDREGKLDRGMEREDRLDRGMEREVSHHRDMDREGRHEKDMDSRNRSFQDQPGRDFRRTEGGISDPLSGGEWRAGEFGGRGTPGRDRGREPDMGRRGIGDQDRRGIPDEDPPPFYKRRRFQDREEVVDEPGERFPQDDLRPNRRWRDGKGVFREDRCSPSREPGPRDGPDRRRGGYGPGDDLDPRDVPNQRMEDEEILPRYDDGHGERDDRDGPRRMQKRRDLSRFDGPRDVDRRDVPSRREEPKGLHDTPGFDGYAPGERGFTRDGPEISRGAFGFDGDRSGRDLDLRDLRQRGEERGPGMFDDPGCVPRELDRREARGTRHEFDERRGPSREGRPDREKDLDPRDVRQRDQEEEMLVDERFARERGPGDLPDDRQERRDMSRRGRFSAEGRGARNAPDRRAEGQNRRSGSGPGRPGAVDRGPRDSGRGRSPVRTGDGEGGPGDRGPRDAIREPPLESHRGRSERDRDRGPDPDRPRGDDHKDREVRQRGSRGRARYRGRRHGLQADRREGRHSYRR